ELEKKDQQHDAQPAAERPNRPVHNRRAHGCPCRGGTATARGSVAQTTSEIPACFASATNWMINSALVALSASSVSARGSEESATTLRRRNRNSFSPIKRFSK